MKSHLNISDKVYKSLKKQIINEKLKPGERLLDTELASEFGVSRTPVREALTRLSNEGLVEIIPRRGVYVKRLNEKDIREIYQIRKVLEGLATKEATLFIDEKQLQRLSFLLEKAEQSLSSENWKACMEFDIELHGMIISNCQNDRLISIMHNLSTLVHAFRMRLARDKERARQALKEHKAILEAIKARDAEKAKKMMMEHIEKAKERIFNYFGFY
ncbi:MAG TPA: GntR family transcriptional regulator [Candidatus Aerophobetes bacterium]|uniref:GntR family transcriptional regulator n=1 Tax=Aerophobetes bacterium TaxID=2030807 RepID=A0A7V5LZI8_UNCAE|nr:GntR family transcriptional regulator [Candidatus Aerophobetes bacterium]